MAQLILHVHYPVIGSARLSLSGTAPLQWNSKLEPTSQTSEGATFCLEFDQHLDFKVRLDDVWSLGRNYCVKEGGEFHIHPHFLREHPVVDVYPELVHFKGSPLAIELFLPPSYAENPYKRYPVIYAQDGQNLFDTPTPETHTHWHLDTLAHELMQVGLCEELIIVGLHHRGVDRMLDYTPFVDPNHGGGGAGEYAKFLVDVVKPLIDKRLRTRPEASNTAVMGSSLGGLFSFYAGRTFPHVFGKVAALSTSFQWDGGHMLRETKRSTRFAPIKLYLDAGTEGDEIGAYELMEQMVQELLFDGFQLGRDFYALTGVGDDHSEQAWSRRVHFPLAFLFPWQPLSHQVSIESTAF